MLERLLPPVRIAIEPMGAALLAPRSATRALFRAAGEPAPAIAALVAAQGLRGRRVELVVDDDLARIWQVVPPAGAMRQADLDAAVTLRFRALYGDAPTGWEVAADHDASRPFVAVGLPSSLVDGLRQACVAPRLAIVSLQPRIVAAWNRHCRALEGDAWLALVHDDVLTLAAGAGRLQVVRAAAVPDGAGAAWLAQHVAREADCLELPGPGRLALCGQAPAAWLRQNTDGIACRLLAGEEGAA